MFQADQLPKEYLSVINRIPKEKRELLEQYYGLNGTPALTIEQLAELRRDPDVNTNAIRAAVMEAVGELRETYARYGY